MNQVRDAEKHPERAVHAGQLYAMGLIDEASHVLMARYREQFDPGGDDRRARVVLGQVGAEALGKLLLTFVEEFPGTAVMRGRDAPAMAGRKDRGNVAPGRRAGRTAAAVDRQPQRGLPAL